MPYGPYQMDEKEKSLTRTQPRYDCNIMPDRHQSRFEEVENHESQSSLSKNLTKIRSRIMYIECKADPIDNPGRIGRVFFNKSGKTLFYKDKRFQSLSGAGYKAYFSDLETGEHYWISGPRKDGNDRLYGGS